MSVLLERPRTLVADALGVPAHRLVPLGRAAGRQAECHLYRAPCGDVVLKLFRDAGSAAAAAAEFQALARFHQAPSSASGVEAPEPLVLLPAAGAYVMRRAQGVPLDRLGRRPRLSAGDLELLAARIATGLLLYEDAVGAPHGDFHPGNVLVEPATLRVTFIDPTFPNRAYAPIAAGARYGAVAADLGYWTFAVAARSPRLRLRRPWLPARLVVLGRAVVAQAAVGVAPEAQAVFHADVLATSRRYVEFLRASGGFRERLAAQAATWELGLLERQAATP